MKRVYGIFVLTCAMGFGSMAASAQNTAYGTGALGSVTSGSTDSAFGFYALGANTTGSSNTAAGALALAKNVSGTENTAFGQNALTTSTGSSNTAVGATALNTNSTGNSNTATGDAALFSNTSGSVNIAAGNGSLYYNTTGSDNAGFASNSLYSNTTGSQNTAIGYSALSGNTTGGNNIALGYQAGANDPGASNFNIDIGNPGSNTDSGITRIGNYQTKFFAAGIDGVSISSGVEVFINSSGQLGTVNSSIRYKEDVRDMADASNKLLQLRPVTYRYKQAYADGSKPLDYGLIAEEVALVYPDLVARDSKGDIQTVQYQKLTPMLLNEVQKQQQRLEAQQKTIDLLLLRLSALESATVSANSKPHVAAE